MDSQQRFYFRDSAVRGQLCRLTTAHQAVMERHAYPACVRDLLGEMMAAVVLMSGSLKFAGSFILQIQGDGPVNLLMAECNDRGDLRAIAQYEAADLPEGHPCWTALIGNGQLIMTIDPDQGERYQGIVALEGEHLADALGHYFAQSEQLPTQFYLGADADGAGGLMLQVMPGHDQDADADLWPRVNNLAATVKTAELTGLEAEQLLFRLYHEEVVELMPAQPLRFQCSCSRERSANALRSLGIEELHALLAEQSGALTVDCQFCRQQYRFDAIDVEQLLLPTPMGSRCLQ